MKFFADENIDRQIVEILRQTENEVHYIMELEPGISDDQIIKKANQESALLITADKDFGEIVFRQKRITEGVILIRLPGISPKNKADIVKTAIQEHAEELEHNFTVITPGVVRIRK